MAPRSTAEWCKKYRQNIKKYIEKRIPYKKETITQKWKLVQLLTKKGYEFSETKNKKFRQRVKESIATATAASLVTEQNDDSAFSQAHIRSRSAAKTLPKSPRKRKKVISALANKFKLCIRLWYVKKFLDKRNI